ncbi:Hpt domain-containing protein, partial [Bradyrhizobium sp. 179]|uniref:Hpt domain-containing protein n=1 Tax=Bradyrhizobium sp. 179 TaxID=2782648 RepID=UPI001FFB551E
MDDLLREFLTETSESLDTVDNQLVKFEQEPNNAKILDNIFRLVHTIKGTCGFLGLPRLEALAHAGETLMGKFRDGMPVTGQAVTVILSSIDRIKEILAGLEASEAEPEGNDRDLIDKLEAMVEQGMAAMAAGASAAPVADAPPLVPEAPAAAPAKAMTTGALIEQTLERPLRPGEVSLDELERAFRETAIEAPVPVAAVAKAEVRAAPAPALDAPAPAAKETAKDAAKPKAKPAPKRSLADEGAAEGDRIANQSIRVNVDTLE